MKKRIINQYNPDFVSPPGETLDEVIKELGMPKSKFSQRAGIEVETLEGIIKGISPITKDTAKNLENITTIKSSFWIKREQQYQKALRKK